ncbi:uncharacterized protein [Periplaneta americana]|uniref:uncharacterized protein isoform X1 n=1 Tax=Periplaneta americana TaxID=6978 RepID=UPI0037E8FADC
MVIRFTIEQRSFICSNFLKNKSPAQCRREFQERFPGVDPPNRRTVHKIVHKFKTTGSVLDKKSNRRRHILTEETLDDIGSRLEQSPQKSLTKIAQEAGVSRSSAFNARKLLKFNPYRYKVTELHALEPGDAHRRISFCSWFLQSVNDGHLDPQLVMFSDEAWFHLHGRVNTENSRYWSVDNPRLTHESPKHDPKVGVWCVISAKRIIGPIFLHKAVNDDQYQALILDRFFPQLTEEERRYGVFQENRARAHPAATSLRAIVDIFDERLISELWPVRSPDLTPCDFYLWCSLKDKVYKSNPRTLDELQSNIREEIANISEAELQRVNKNVLRRYNACLAANGEHFQHRL